MKFDENTVLRFEKGINPNGGQVDAIGPGGERFNLTLTPAQVHTTEELSTYLAGYSPFAFRADDVSPIVPVDKTRFYYRTFSADDAFLHVDTHAGLTSPPVMIDPNSTVTEGYTENHSVGSLVPVQTEDNANFFSPRAKAGKRCMNAILLNREKRVMDLVGTNTNWASGQRHTIGATANWNGGADADPILDIQTAIQASNQEVTDIFMNRVVSDAFMRNDKVKDHMRQWLGDQPGQQVARLNDYRIPGLPPIHVVSSKLRTASGGALSYTLGNHCVLVSRPPGVPEDGEDVAATYSFRERGADGVGIMIREWFVEGAGVRGAYMVNVTVAERQIMTANDAGGHIASVVT
jgi:hypothetical protein